MLKVCERYVKVKKILEDADLLVPMVYPNIGPKTCMVKFHKCYVPSDEANGIALDNTDVQNSRAVEAFTKMMEIEGIDKVKSKFEVYGNRSTFWIHFD